LKTTAVHAAKSTEKGDATRERLLEAALFLFGERGFEGASVRDIAAEAGVSQGLIRFHFGSKEGLRRVIDERLVASLYGALDELPERPAESLFDALGVAWTRQVGGPEAVRLSQRYMIRASIDEGEAGRRFRRQMVQFYKSIFAEWSSSSRVRDDVDETWAVMMMTSLVMGTYVLAATFEQEFGLELTDPEIQGRRRRVIWEVLEHGLLAADRPDSDDG